MKCGNLVRITKARIGVPAGSIGLIIGCGESKPRNFFIYEIQLTRADNRVVLRLERDLEQQNEQR